MHVKKFEARTMKEALEMVKVELGPDAIIMGVKDHGRNFGLVGGGSVEITAAISENNLHKKRFLESKLSDEKKAQLQKSTAKSQKKVIERAVENYQLAEKSRVKGLRYVDILDDGQADPLVKQTVDKVSFGNAEKAKVKVDAKAVAKTDAWPDAKRDTENDSKFGKQQVVKFEAPVLADVASPSQEVQRLRSEVVSLRLIIEEYQNRPQQQVMSAYPGSAYNLNHDVSSMFEKLDRAGISHDLIVEILQEATAALGPVQIKKKAMVDAFVARYILTQTNVLDEKADRSIQVFIGPSGHGKTTAMIKMAAQQTLKNKKKVCLVTCDTHKVGAVDQLKIYSQILQTPLFIIRQRSDWTQLEAKLSEFQYILVDCMGSSMKSSQDILALQGLQPPESWRPQTHLVLSSTTKDADAAEWGQRFAALRYDDVIFTALDQAVDHGVIYNFNKRFRVPLHSFGIGSKIPEDFERASKERMLDLIFKISRLRSQEHIEYSRMNGS